MSGIRVMIADSSTVFRKMFASAVVETAENAAVSYASNCGEVLEAIGNRSYDVVVLDQDTPGEPDAQSALNGLNVLNVLNMLEKIAAIMPKAVILVTARPSSANNVFFAEAAARGATDWMVKPIYGSYGENLAAVKNKMADVMKIVRVKSKPPKEGLAPAKRPTAKRDFHPEFVLIAASTGGPAALENILSGLDAAFPAPVLVVQHTLPQFTETLAQSLDKKSKLRVKVAEDGEQVAGGTVYLAPSGLHMRLSAERRIYFDDAPPLNGVRPAADALFESAADFPSVGVLAVVLTGMGRDGEKGLAKLKKKQKCFCMAQSERTCVVYGMPRAAAESGLADMILDLDKIAGEMSGFSFAAARMEKRPWTG